MKFKILCLGNEFILEDSLAKKIGRELKNKGFDVLNLENSYQLIENLQSDEKIIILDVVENLDNVKFVDIDNLSQNKILTLHDLDSCFFLKLFGKKKDIKIIGIPQKGNFEKIKNMVLELIKNFSF